jgi:hemolysin III
VFIAASYTPVAVLALDAPLGTVVLVSAWAGALAGVVLTLAWTDAPRALRAASYLATGWVAVVALPGLLDGAGLTATVLYVVGGALYSAGAAVYALKRPDPWPRTFGFHEVFHALVVAAVVVHFVAVAGWVLPQAG